MFVMQLEEILNLKILYKSNIPNFSVDVCAISKVIHHEEQNQVCIHFVDESRVTVVASFSQYYNGYKMKNAYHLTEADALKRLKANIHRVFNTREIIVNDRERTLANMKMYCDQHPEWLVNI